MDLHELRSFIESQKMRLLEDKKSIISGRFTPGIYETQNIVPTKDSTVGHSSGFSKDVKCATQAADLITERINSLNTFKSDVGAPYINNTLEEYESQPPPSNLCLEVPKEQSPSTLGSPLHPKLQPQTPTAKISPVKSCWRSRDEEVERLQEKLASQSFWDGFGTSATAKRWSADSQDTMVRVGEFSPANPDLQAPLGLGEYEERRRQLLEKKKLEYKDYLSKTSNCFQRTDHLQHPVLKSTVGFQHLQQEVNQKDAISGSASDDNVKVDAATQTDSWLAHVPLADVRSPESAQVAPAESKPTTLSVETSLQPLSPRVPRAQSSQTRDALPDTRLRQLQLQEELRWQIEEKRRLEAERREQERLEEEALQRRVAEQQARLQAEYERDEKLRHEREIQKQQQMEEFQRRQEELKAESEAIKQGERRQKLEAAENWRRQEEQQHLSDSSKGSKNANLVPPCEPTPLSILKCNSPPLRNMRTTASVSRSVNRPLDDGPVSPRALVRVLEGPTISKRSSCLDDSLPIPLMPIAHSHPSPQLNRSPRLSPHISPHHSPGGRRSPSRFIADLDWPNSTTLPRHRSKPSEAMRNLEARWKVPAVQKNVCVRGDIQDSNTGNVLTQLGAFRRQLQMEHMRMEEKVKEGHHPQQYQQQYYQQHIHQ